MDQSAIIYYTASMRVTRWGEYGILCCMYMARRSATGVTEPSPIDPSAERNTAIGAAEIAEAQSIPLQYTQQILHRLRKGGVIKSIRGPRGGFCLSRNPDNINLKDILYAAEGDTFEVICETDPIRPNAEHPHRCSSDYVCGLKHVWYNLKATVNQLLEQHTLQQLIDVESAQESRALPSEQLVSFPPSSRGSNRGSSKVASAPSPQSTK